MIAFPAPNLPTMHLIVSDMFQQRSPPGDVILLGDGAANEVYDVGQDAEVDEVRDGLNLTVGEAPVVGEASDELIEVLPRLLLARVLQEHHASHRFSLKYVPKS